jgi:hypothetical protein
MDLLIYQSSLQLDLFNVLNIKRKEFIHIHLKLSQI